MPNTNYNSGRKFEYRRMKELRAGGWEVLRTAGSHGPWDLVAIAPDGSAVFIQCKRVERASQVRALRSAFLKEHTHWKTNHQCLSIYVKETRLVEHTYV